MSPTIFGRFRTISTPQRKNRSIFLRIPHLDGIPWTLNFSSSSVQRWKKFETRDNSGGERGRSLEWIPMNQSSTDDRLNWTKRPRRKPYRLKRTRDQEDLSYVFEHRQPLKPGHQRGRPPGRRCSSCRSHVSVTCQGLLIMRRERS